MTYKNGIKEYSLSAVLFGIPMGVIYGFGKASVIAGVIYGVVCGVLFALFLFIFIKITEKKFDKKREEIAKDRKIICDGVATINGNGGWMFFTEYGIEFYPHKINFSTKEVIIPIDTIESVTTLNNHIIVSADSTLVAIHVSHRKEWKKQIDAALAEDTQK